MEIISNIITFFEQLQRNMSFNRAGKIFHTRNNAYFYDTGTGKVFACENDEYKIIELLLTSSQPFEDLAAFLINDSKHIAAAENIIELVKQEHILQVPYYQGFAEQHNLDGKLKQLTLEVTQRCNLRCKYCIYNEGVDQFRSFTFEDMNWETAKAALDFANENGADDLIIGFYGGEPFLNADLIKKCISYSLDHLAKSRYLVFTVTSNLILMNDELAEYLSKVPNIQVVCSLDGPFDIQNEFRIFPDYKGTYDKTLAGLQCICKAFGAKAYENVSIHSVVCPPFTESKMNQLRDFFDNSGLFPKEMVKDLALVGGGTLSKDDMRLEDDLSSEEFYKQGMDKVNNVKFWALNELCKNADQSGYPFRIEQGALMKMHTRFITDEPANVLFRNACCVPGVRKLYVDVHGNYSVCERVGNTPFIGNVQTGLNVDVIKQRYFSDYDEFSIDKCNHCWAMHLCTMCYARCYNEKGIDMKAKEQNCIAARSEAFNNLIEYYQIMEENPEIISLLDRIYTAKI